MERGAKGPVSVVLSEELRSEVEREAARRGLGLSPAMRVLVAERLAELREEADLSRAERWQRAQAWASWEDEDNPEVGWDAVEAAFVPEGARTQRKRRS